MWELPSACAERPPFSSVLGSARAHMRVLRCSILDAGAVAVGGCTAAIAGHGAGLAMVQAPWRPESGVEAAAMFLGPLPCAVSQVRVAAEDEPATPTGRQPARNDFSADDAGAIGEHDRRVLVAPAKVRCHAAAV